ncbi:hypothetical protein SLH49_02030 [Cognatiyoonia sp. IB215446]|uniref:hypothetical protein n=1 Tax=Cognatiyoonia sp. IB215446 TaxID=3097355 RepID=UPI002A16827F|nr:hypothetical protein [Cognatiyoonia sp. IB215446]MDX8346753.1 hypothetical protein [Cognatiyoonia sp. IB215446]
MPFVSIALALFSAMLVVWLASAALFLPSLLILAGAILYQFPQIAFFGTMAVVVATTSVVPLMIGARLGIQSQGTILKTGYGKLVLPGLGYGLFEALTGIFTFSIAFLVFMAISPLSFADFSALAEDGSDVLIARAIEENQLLALIIIGLVAVLLTAFRAAMLVPLTGAGISKDPGNKGHTPFMGFGTCFGSLFVVVVLSYLLSAAAWPAIGQVATLMGLDPETLSNSAAGQPPVTGTQVAILVGVFITFTLWVFSLQAAGGVMAYRHLEKMLVDDRDQEQMENRMSQEDMRALWKSRMPTGHK